MADHPKYMRRHISSNSAVPKDIVSFEVALKSKEQVARGTFAFVFEKPAGFQFKAGQHARVTLIDPPETDAMPSLYLAIAWKVRFWSRKSSKFGSAIRDGLPFEVTSKMAMIRFESGYGSGRNNTP